MQICRNPNWHLFHYITLLLRDPILGESIRLMCIKIIKYTRCFIIKCYLRVTGIYYYRFLGERASLWASVAWEIFMVEVRLDMEFERLGWGIDWWMGGWRVSAALVILSFIQQLTESPWCVKHGLGLIHDTSWIQRGCFMLPGLPRHVLLLPAMLSLWLSTCRLTPSSGSTLGIFSSMQSFTLGIMSVGHGTRLSGYETWPCLWADGENFRQLTTSCSRFLVCTMKTQPP